MNHSNEFCCHLTPTLVTIFCHLLTAFFFFFNLHLSPTILQLKSLIHEDQQYDMSKAEVISFKSPKSSPTHSFPPSPHYVDFSPSPAFEAQYSPSSNKNIPPLIKQNPTQIQRHRQISLPVHTETKNHIWRLAPNSDIFKQIEIFPNIYNMHFRQIGSTVFSFPRIVE